MAAVWRILIDVDGEAGAASGLIAVLNEYQKRYVFRYAPGSSRLSAGGVRAGLRLSSDQPDLFCVSRELGLRISTRNHTLISHYLGLTPSQYLTMAALLGLVQWRVLEQNMLINPEDCPHTGSSRCLYAPAATVQDSVILLDMPQICGNCRDFYCCMGAETEICLLQALIDWLYGSDLTRMTLRRRLDSLGHVEGSNHGCLHRPAER